MTSKKLSDITDIFKKMKFKKKILGGVDERDVWRQLDKLQKEYQEVYDAKGIEENKDDITPGQVIKARRFRLFNKAEIISFFTKLILLIVMIYVIFGFVFGITTMKNNDMSPKISAGDLMLYYRLEEDFHNRDVIIYEKDSVIYTGRIVAKEGDTVEVTDDSELKINGVTATENSIYYSTPKYDDYVSYPITLKENQYFVLCDFREGAKDSRYFGIVESSEIKGKVITILRRMEL